jgi:predicted transposase YbfD/YdcC
MAAAPAPEDELAEEKAQAERSLAPDLRRRVPLGGRLVSGDALYCQHALGAQIRQAHGHYRLVIKANQPELLAEVGLLFEPPPPGEPCMTASSRRTQRERHPVRTLSASAALADELTALGWAGAPQVLRLQRGVPHLRGVHAGQTTQLVRYFLTSLRAQVPVRPLVRLIREHWHLENRLHSGREGTLGEDGSHVRCGAAPHALAAVRTAPCWGCCANTTMTTSPLLCASSLGPQVRRCASSACILHNEKTLCSCGIPLDTP